MFTEKFQFLYDTFAHVVTRGAVQFGMAQCILYPSADFYVTLIAYYCL